MTGEIAGAPSGSRIAYLDGIRAVAILAVLVVHWAEPYLPRLRGGYVGVDVFFVLSGFLITSLLWHRVALEARGWRGYADFMAKRSRRLLPALVAFLVLTTALVAVVGEPVTGTTASLSAALALAQAGSIVEGLRLATLDPFGHTWSLSIEWMYYLVWPWAVILMKRRGRTEMWAFSVTTSIAVVAYAVSLLSTPEWFYFGPTSRMAQLLAGCAASFWLMARPSAAITQGNTDSDLLSRWMPRCVAAALSVVVVWTVAGPAPYAATYRFLGFPLITVCAVALCVGPRLVPTGRAVRLLTMRPASALGRCSYSLYLWHPVGIQVLTRDTWGLPTPVLGAVAVVGTGVTTFLSYRFLERPRTRSGSRLDRRASSVPEESQE